jgi:hypothetical protein
VSFFASEEAEPFALQSPPNPIVWTSCIVRFTREIERLQIVRLTSDVNVSDGEAIPFLASGEIISMTTHSILV